jgi:large subunit ribosomal protein L3
MLHVIGTKARQTQKFLVNGTRIPVTVVSTPGNTVMMTKTQDKEGYWSVQLGYGARKNTNKPQMGHAKKAQLDKAPIFIAEARFSEKEAANLPAQGDLILASTVLEPGDIIDARGKSKGKGFAGGVKRHGFRGGPKTHGQSDRHRAPGSIGSGTTPGRVYKGKRMAGKMGNDMTTLKNLEVVKVGEDFVWVKGVVPGPIGAVVVLSPTGKKNKKFVEVIKTTEEQAVIDAAALEAAKAEAEAIEKAAAEAAKEAAIEVPNETKEPKGTEEISEPVVEVQADAKESSDAKAMDDKEEPVVEAPEEPKKEEVAK